MEEIVNSPYFATVIVPLLICLARVTDVTIGTLRIIFVSKGYKLLAPILGFFEITIWLMAITQVMKNLDNYVNILAFATGYSLGNFIGIWLENRLAIGMVVMRIITKRDSKALVEALKKQGFNVTVADAEGNLGAVSIIFMNLKRSQINKVTTIIYEYNPLATYSIEDVRRINEPYEGEDITHSKLRKMRRFFPTRLKK